MNDPVVLDAELRGGTFRKAAHDMGIRSLVYEAGEAPLVSFGLDWKG